MHLDRLSTRDTWGGEKRIIFLTLNTVFLCLFTCSNELLTFPISIAQSKEIKSVLHSTKISPIRACEVHVLLC